MRGIQFQGGGTVLVILGQTPDPMVGLSDPEVSGLIPMDRLSVFGPAVGQDGR